MSVHPCFISEITVWICMKSGPGVYTKSYQVNLILVCKHTGQAQTPPYMTFKSNFINLLKNSPFLFFKQFH
jgi:hypothetical protein